MPADTETAAIEEIRAVKLIGEDTIEGIGMPFGGPFNGRDLDGETFNEKTDFAFDWFAERPLLYQHGLDDGTGLTVVGRVKSWELRSGVGVWVQAQLDKSHEYFDAIKELIKKGKLFFSSGAMRHLIETNTKTGEIKTWPWVELSLTPTPSNLLAQVGMAAAKAHFEAAGLKTDSSAWDVDADTDGKAVNKDAFWGHVEKQPGGKGHWLWTGAKNDKGYGILEVDGATVRAHRVAYEMEHGPIPDDKDVGHKTDCANTSCVRASHLELVTNEENAAERAIRKAAIATKPGFEETESQIRYRVSDPGEFQEGTFRTMPVQGVEGVQFVIGRPKGETTTRVQSVHFDSDKWTMARAHTWIENHKDLQAGKGADILDMLAGLDSEEKAAPGLVLTVQLIADADDLEKIPFVKHADLVADFAASLTERTKDLAGRRLKEGRMLSAANKKRLAACMDAMGAAIDELRNLLSDAEPEVKAEDLQRQMQRLDILRLYEATIPRNGG